MRQTAHQIAGGDLLRVLQLLLTQTTLVIHRRHFEQYKIVGQTLGGQRENVRATINHQRHFVIGKALPCR
ncbi:Uncharacterised protein [Salmonella enterica subsp. enterica serovar Bovismorbificans]|uniref:Uncharacterized protein n=1 Tax=Salmonella enterica subsp. enterica serovar Bovismorbificans TaxID=58097 RepID=A0A655BZD7_SALET|nr:Uncharacterised protein [Salmonella enterica subsp. enterica serovar Bovismorbificans]